MAHAAEHLAASGQNFFARLLLQIVAERVVGGDEEPGLAALLQEAARDAVPHRPRCHRSSARYWASISPR